eukprot:1157400-Pelagomonas_calceolata.AAC.3
MVQAVVSSGEEEGTLRAVPEQMRNLKASRLVSFLPGKGHCKGVGVPQGECLRGVVPTPPKRHGYNFSTTCFCSPVTSKTQELVILCQDDSRSAKQHILLYPPPLYPLTQQKDRQHGGGPVVCTASFGQF